MDTFAPAAQMHTGGGTAELHGGDPPVRAPSVHDVGNYRRSKASDIREVRLEP
jgi:hypothetical protein